MLGVLVRPDFSHIAAASLTIAVLLLVLAGVVAVRIRRHRPLGYAQRRAVAVTVVDIAFMSVAVLLMPIHFTAAQLASAPLPTVQLPSVLLTRVPQFGGSHVGETHLAVAGGAMIWLVLVTWAFCASVLSAPAIRRRSPDGALQIVCSGCMITAMAVMAI